MQCFLFSLPFLVFVCLICKTKAFSARIVHLRWVTFDKGACIWASLVEASKLSISHNFTFLLIVGLWRLAFLLK